MIVHVYFDETGLEGKDGLLRWIGLSGLHQTWGFFHERWVSILKTDPPIQFWHTVSAHNGRLKVLGSEQRLPRDARLLKEARLCEALGYFGDRICSIEVEMRMDDHHRIVAGQVKNRHEIWERALRFVDSPIVFAMAQAVLQSAKAAAQFAARMPRVHDPVQIWVHFENSESLADFQDDMCFVAQVFRRLLVPEDRKILGPVIFVDGKGSNALTPLQAADLFAWHVQAPDHESQPGWQDLRRMPRNRIALDSQVLQRMVDHLNAGRRWELMEP